MDWQRLLGPSDAESAGGGWCLRPDEDGTHAVEGVLTSEAAADLAARLRGLGFDGRALICEITPPLRRSAVRRARTEDARRRRRGTPGFRRSGVRIDDDEGRWSLTPEALALSIAEQAEGRAIVDATCGVGGNAIAFARRGCSVVAIERDRGRLDCARHNARIYGVADRISFVHSDAREQVGAHASAGAVLFVDPPWGEAWNRTHTSLGSLPLLAELLPAASGFAALWAKVPPSFATAELLGDGPGDARAVFGEAEGDRRRVKFVLVRRRQSLES